MKLSNLKVALRSVSKNRTYSAINIIGLAVGLAVSVMIMLFVQQESSFDSMVEDNDRVYRLNWENVGTGARFATFFNPVSPIIADSLPDDVELLTRIAPRTDLLTIGDRRQFESFAYVDPNFFEMFSYQTLAGAEITDFTDMRGAILTEAAALNLFGRVDPIGEVFTVDGDNDFQVRSVISNNPVNSHLTSNIFLTMENLLVVSGRANFFDNMFSDQLYHYMKLAEGVELTAFKEKLMDVMVDKVHPEAREILSVPMQLVTDIHFTTDLQNEMSIQDSMTGVSKPLRQKSDVYIFGIVALLTLVIATFNFTNMQIAQSSKRVKEIGVRKTLGASRSDIFWLFLAESVVMALLALLGALFLVEVLATGFGNLLGVPLAAAVLYSVDVLGGLFLVVLLLALISGLYPALFLAGLVPTTALRGELIQGVGSAKIRASLVVLQFAVAIGLFTASGVVNDQIDFAMNKPLGYEPANVLVVNNVNAEAVQILSDELRSNPDVISVSGGSVIPTEDLSDGSGFSIVGGDPDFSVATRTVTVADNYFTTLGMEVLAGRALSDDFTSDRVSRATTETPEVSGGIMLNEKAAISAGFANPADAVGTKLYSAFTRGGVNYRYDYEVVGVVKDMHFGSVRSDVVPVSFTLGSYIQTAVVKTKPGKLVEVGTLVDGLWAELVPDFPIRRGYLEDTYKSFYAVEGRTFDVFVSFSVIAVLIACLGLYGLASFAAERRVKEVGIRKVMGATVWQIVTLLSWELSKLVVIANVIAWPAAWLLMNDWLTSFVYRVDMTVVPFIVAGVVSLALAWLTTSLKAYGVAKLNPIYALRHE